MKENVNLLIVSSRAILQVFVSVCQYVCLATFLQRRFVNQIIKFNQINFANLIAKNSKTQVIIVRNEIELSKYFQKNLISNEIIIGMGAGIISKWIAGLKVSL